MIDRVLHHTSSVIARGITKKGLSRTARRRYTRQVLVANIIFCDFPKSTTRATEANITFFEEDVLGINPHNDDPLVITVQRDNWDIKHILLDSGSSSDVLLWDVL